MPSYTEVTKPTAPSYSAISSPGEYVFELVPFFSAAYYPFLDTGTPFTRLASYKPSFTETEYLVTEILEYLITEAGEYLISVRSNGYISIDKPA